MKILFVVNNFFCEGNGLDESARRTVKALREAGFRGFLIGENFMRTDNPGQSLKDFINQLTH